MDEVGKSEQEPHAHRRTRAFALLETDQWERGPVCQRRDVASGVSPKNAGCSGEAQLRPLHKQHENGGFSGSHSHRHRMSPRFVICPV